MNLLTGGELVVSLANARPDWAHHRGASFAQTEHAVQLVTGTRLAAIAGASTFQVNSRHQQGVVSTGPGAIVCAWSEDGVVEAIEVPGKRFCIGTQWHPEFLLSPPERSLFEAFVQASRR